MEVHWLQVAGGIGAFLFSLRFLTRQLQRSLSWRVRSTLLNALQTPWRCLATGFLMTVLVQASSVTILGAMGLLAASFITLEQGFYVVLGAAVGTTLKAWYAGIDPLHWGPAIVGFCSLSLVFAKRPLTREVLSTLMAVGFAFWGLNEVSQGLLPFAHSTVVSELLREYQGGGWYPQLMGILIGAGLTMAMQSSSTTVILTLHLADQGVIEYWHGATLILGANLGTTFIPLLASLEYSVVVRRLAFAYLFEKLAGVFVTWLCLPGFLRVVDLLVPGIPGGPTLSAHLAGVHTLFNVLCAICWGIFPGIILKPVSRLIGGATLPTEELPPVVRRLLQRSPGRATQEAQRQLHRLNTRVKEVLEETVQALGGKSRDLVETAADMLFNDQQQFRSMREGLLDLNVAGLRHEESEGLAQGQVRILALLDGVNRSAAELRRVAVQGLAEDGFWLPPAMDALLQKSLPPLLDELWLMGTATEAEGTTRTHSFLQDLHQALCVSISDHGLSSQHREWLFEIYLATRFLLLAMEDVVRERRKI